MGAEIPDNKKLGSILNNDGNNILMGLDNAEATPEEYKAAVLYLLDTKPGVLAQCVGQPDPVTYRSEVATMWDKYHPAELAKLWSSAAGDPQGPAVRSLRDAGTDVLAITIEACRERGVLIVPSYRMNGEDFGHAELNMYDFGRENKDLRIPGTNCLDPAHPKVFNHRMEIFAEVANNYDIDGIELNWRRWTHMISNPEKNHVILTKMVRETRKMLDEVANKKGRKRLLLGVRVGTSIAQPGGSGFDASCKAYGLDVETWVKEGLVDYVCPSLFWPKWPGLPDTREFAELVKDADVGVYPTLFPIPKWIDDGPIEVDDTERLMRYKNEFCKLALQLYNEGADGISTFNWTPHHQPGMIRKPGREVWGVGAKKVQMRVHAILSDRAALEKYLKSDSALEQ